MSSEFELRGDFQSDVIAASRSTPVLVDFWAAWCGPCRVLGPVLEKLAREAGGRWRLVKVDTEQHQDVARRYGIRGIPAVKLFHHESEIAEFVGALPEQQVRSWLGQHLPRPSAAAFAQALALLERGDDAGARRGFEHVLQADADNHAARVQLARILLGADPKRAQELAAGVPDSATEFEVAQNVGLLARLLRWAAGDDIEITASTDAAPDDLDLYRDGARALRDGDPARALEKWVALVSRNRVLDDDGARRACVALFSLLGENNETTQTWRRRFSSALY